MEEIILGSISPRRRQILGNFSLPFVAIAPEFDESSLPFLGDPEEYAWLLAKGKATSLTARYPSQIVLAADTIVYHEGRIFPKPDTEQVAFDTLCALVGRWHRVYTAVCAIKEGQIETVCMQTEVEFHNLTPEQIRHYHLSVHCMDKAGAYAIQGAGSLIVKRIAGCFYNVLGLPVQGVRQVLLPFGIDLWNYLA